MSQKISTNESHLENISIKDRPMNISAEYEELVSGQWLTAKTELDEYTDAEEAEKIKLLREVLTVS